MRARQGVNETYLVFRESSRTELTKLQKLAKLLDGQARIANDPAERESVDGVMARNNKNAAAVRHDNMLTLTHYFETGFFKSTNGIEMADAGDLGQD